MTHEGTIQHMSNTELMPVSENACDGEEKLNGNADPPRRCSGWASALTSLRAVKHMTMLCTGLRSTLLGDELLWSMLRRRRSDALAASAPLASLPRLTPDARVCSAHIVPHGTPAVLSMPLSDAVEIETWQAIEEQVRAWLFGHVAPAAGLEWLVHPPEGCAAPDALTQLAVISALRKCKAAECKWGVPAELLHAQWGCPPPSLGAELLALQAAGALPAGCLQAHIEVKRYSWSQARDCRGFRARDDVAVRRATLRELATCDVRRPTQADGRSGETAACEVAENCAAIWGVLAKGATLEVQRVTLRVQ